jgi:glycolate oxidase iron-sulfur subunit
MERHAPRGRVQMVKKYLEGDLTITKSLYEALMSCILCESCSAACPSGVRLDRVFENMRMELHERFGTKLPKRLIFHALKNPVLLRLGAKIGRIGREAFIAPLNVGWKLGAIPINRLPRFNARPFRSTMGGTVPAKGKRRGRVLYFTGCATDLINEDVGRAVTDVLTSLGIEVVIPREQVCCSVPIFLSGARGESMANVNKNLDIFDQDDADAIVVDCATCGGALKKSIPHLVEDLGGDVEKAKRVASKVKDVSEIVADRLEDLELDESKRAPRRKVTYHDPCHLVRGMKVSEHPRRLLEALPHVDYTEMTGADECCGGAGSFQFEHVELSKGVTARKTENIRAAGADIVATGCPGCSLTLSGNLYEEGDPIVVHTLQLTAERLRKQT